jgi:hypothetical protein
VSSCLALLFHNDDYLVWHSASTSILPFTLPFLCALATIGAQTTTTPPQKTVARSAPSTPKAFANTQEKVETLLDEYRPKLRQFVEQDISLPLWIPPSDLDQNTRSHLESLNLPVLREGSKFPSLLLHNLEHVHHDPGLSDRLRDLFNVNRSKFVPSYLPCDKTDLLKVFCAIHQDLGKHA